MKSDAVIVEESGAVYVSHEHGWFYPRKEFLQLIAPDHLTNLSNGDILGL